MEDYGDLQKGISYGRPGIMGEKGASADGNLNEWG